MRAAGEAGDVGDAARLPAVEGDVGGVDQQRAAVVVAERRQQRLVDGPAAPVDVVHRRAQRGRDGADRHGRIPEDDGHRAEQRLQALERRLAERRHLQRERPSEEPHPRPPRRGHEVVLPPLPQPLDQHRADVLAARRPIEHPDDVRLARGGEQQIDGALEPGAIEPLVHDRVVERGLEPAADEPQELPAGLDPHPRRRRRHQVLEGGALLIARRHRPQHRRHAPVTGPRRVEQQPARGVAVGLRPAVGEQLEGLALARRGRQRGAHEIDRSGHRSYAGEVKRAVSAVSASGRRRRRGGGGVLGEQGGAGRIAGELLQRGRRARGVAAVQVIGEEGDGARSLLAGQ